MNNIYNDNSKYILIQEVLAKNDADAFLFLSDVNRFWITGFESSAGIVISTKNKIYLFLDMRYYEKAKTIIENDYIEIIPYTNKNQIKDKIIDLNIKNLIVEEEYFLLSDYMYYKTYVEIIIPFNTNILRIQKTNEEIKKMQKACDIACETMEWISKELKPGLTEIEVANMVTSHMLKLGASKNSFDPIVASGVNGSFPHHKPTNKIILNNEFVTIDMGCIYEGYCSDITRTFAIGNPDPILIEAYKKVYESNKKGIESIKYKSYGNEIDKICRDVIDNSQFKGYFVHGTGHGVGINVHEYPNVNQSYDSTLEHNSIVTIEPGIYIPNVGGIRIEDMVLVDGNNNHVVMTKNATKLKF